MTHCTSPFGSGSRTYPLLQIRIWHLVLLVLYVAIAIVDIKDHRRTEPALIGLAASGFTAYAIIGWLGWHNLHRFERRLGLLGVAILYMVAMALLFLTATVVYLALEYAYLCGRR